MRDVRLTRSLTIEGADLNGILSISLSSLSPCVPELVRQRQHVLDRFLGNGQSTFLGITQDFSNTGIEVIGVHGVVHSHLKGVEGISMTVAERRASLGSRLRECLNDLTVDTEQPVERHTGGLSRESQIRQIVPGSPGDVGVTRALHHVSQRIEGDEGIDSVIDNSLTRCVLPPTQVGLRRLERVHEVAHEVVTDDLGDGTTSADHSVTAHANQRMHEGALVVEAG